MTKRIIVHGVPNESAGTIGILAHMCCVPTTLLLLIILAGYIFRVRRDGVMIMVMRQLMWWIRVDTVTAGLGDSEEASARPG